MNVTEDIEVNGKKYNIAAVYAMGQKTRNINWGLDVTLRITVTNLTDNKVMDWKELKDSYLLEKIEEWIKNCINGQRSCYWDYSKENENPELT